MLFLCPKTKKEKEKMAEGNEPKTYSEQEYEALKSQLEDVKKQLESYQETNIEAIKASAEDFKKKWEHSQSRNVKTLSIAQRFLLMLLLSGR